MKIFRDPVHNVIDLDTGDTSVNDLIIALIDSEEMQRLRFIRQLGFTYLAYPSATHTRFEHSLGVAFLAKRLCQGNLTIIAALLHDIGHGPMSHTCEALTEIDHEKWTSEIIFGETEVNAILASFDKNYPQMIYNTLKSSEIISGKVDVDRMDYLLRDSIMTGTGYGLFDLEWLLNVLIITESGEIKVAKKGLSVAEGFEKAREYMYKNVYHHKTNLAAHHMLIEIFDRLKQQSHLCPDERIKKVFLSGNKDTKSLLKDYLALTDTELFYLLKQLTTSPDGQIKKLAYGLLNRKLIKS